MVKARCAHLSERELALARRYCGVTPELVDGPPVAVVVGESPGPNTRGRHPLMPFPVGAAGSRLASYAAMPAGQWLGRFYRRNLFASHVEDGWSAVDARARAAELREWMLSLGSFRVLLLGRRVADAFGIDRPWTRVEEFHVDSGGDTGTTLELLAIPHPSGLNHDYNDPRVRVAAGAAVRWAADLDPARATGGPDFGRAGLGFEAP